MRITRDQFLRGMQAVTAYREMMGNIHAAMMEAGCIEAEGGQGDGVVDELVRQLSERCNDPPLADHGSLIEWMLYEDGGSIQRDGNVTFVVDTPEALWTYWEASQSGPLQTQDERA